MSKQINIRLDKVHLALLEKMVDQLTEEGVKTSKTDVIEKALYSFARDNVLGVEKVSDIVDHHYSGVFRG